MYQLCGLVYEVTFPIRFIHYLINFIHFCTAMSRFKSIVLYF